jgi:hypothetical protein
MALALTTENEMADYKSMFEQAARTLAAIDEALGLPADGCNSTAQTLAKIRNLRAAEDKCNSYIVDNARLADENKTLRYELGRAIAQRDDEADRLDWLMVNLGGNVTRALLGELAHTGDPAEFRARVDDVRGERGQCVRRMSDGRICGLRAASCPDCGPAVHDMPQVA